MNNPDFLSLIDLEEPQEPEQQPSFSVAQPQVIPFQQKESSFQQEEIPDFFSQISDIEAPPPQQGEVQDFFALLEKQPIKTPYDVPELSPEQLKAMSPQERLQYAKDLVTEREYRQSRGVVKGALSGATLGLSEKIPGLKPEEGEFLTGFGEFLGSALPINKLYNVLGAPLVKIATKSPKYAKGLEAFSRMVGFGATGAAYEGAKQTIQEGEFPTPQELLKYGAQWAAFDGALQLAGKAGSFALKLRDFAKSKGIPEKQALTEVIDTLAKEKLDLSSNEAISRAEEIIGKIEPEAKKVEARPSPAMEPAPAAEGIIEETGEGAAQRIEYAKTGLDKVLDKTKDAIEAAKTPAESLKRLGQATNEAIFNVMAPLERLETEIPVPKRASTRIRLAQSVASEIDSVLENGIFNSITGNFEHGGLKDAYGPLTWKKFSKGLKEGEYSLQDLDTLRASRIALRRQAEGKKTGIDTHEAIADINRFQKKYGPIDDRIREFQKATLDFYGKDLLGKPLIEQWNKEYYAPLYRVMDSGKDSILKTGSLKPKQPFKKMVGSERKIIPPSESDPYNASMLISNARKNEAILQYRMLVEEGKLPGKIIPAKNDPIPKEVLQELEIDPKLGKVAETLYNQTRKEGFTPEKNILRGWKDGKPFKIEVPEDIYNIFTTMNPQQRDLLPRALSAMNRLFSKSISMAPRKFVSIMGRDALTSLIYSKTGSNPVSIFEALSDIYHAKPIYKEFLSMGGDVYASRLAERIDRAKRIEDLITPGKEGILVPFEKIGEYFRKYGKSLGDISLAVPLAEYKRALAKYGNTAEGRIMAAMEARRVTYDPTRKGGSKIVRELGNYIPFWNVSLQDLAMLGRNLKTPEAWMKGFAGITVPTLMLKMSNEANPDYQDLTPVDKAAFWHVYFGDKHIRIPIPWLLGTAFKVGAEAFYDTINTGVVKDKKMAQEAWEGLYSNFVEQLSGDLPPLLQNYIQMSTGKTAPSPLGLILGTESRAPEVVPKRLQQLPPHLQYTSKTSQIARLFGDLWGVSPVKLERTIKNLGGLVAADVLALTDEIAYATGMAEDKRPEQREANYLLLGNFVSNSTSSRTKFMNEFYEYLDEATREKNAERVIKEKGLDSKALEEMKYKGIPIFVFNKKIGRLFREMRKVEDSDLSPDMKKIELDSLQREINELYKEAVLEIRKVKG